MTAVTTTIVRDAVDTATLFLSFDVDGPFDGPRFRLRVRNRWRAGTDGRSGIDDYFAVDEITSDSTTQERRETPAGCIVQALASTLTADVVNIAAARGVALAEVTSTVEGDIDLDGVLGLEPSIRTGFEQLHVRFDIKGHATPQQLSQTAQESQGRSTAFDVITRGIAVAVVVDPT